MPTSFIKLPPGLENQIAVNLSNINGIGNSSLELLEAAGFPDVESLTRVGVDELHEELNRANSILKIAKRSPDRPAIEKWIDSARDLVGELVPPEKSPEPPVEAVNYERSPEVIAMLANAPFALPLPARVLKDHHVSVSTIPVGILLDHYIGDLEVKIDQSVPKLPGQARPAVAFSYVKLADTNVSRLDIDTSKLRSTENLQGARGVKPPTRKSSPANDRVALLRGPRASTNAGRDPNSRWYIRGVLHSHPLSTAAGALVTLLVMIMLPLSVVSALLLLLSSQMPAVFGWVPGWLIALPAALPVLGIAYLIWGTSGSCRICNQKLFLYRSHLKNSKAHKVWGLGYIVPLCFHMLVFRWFRCTHCGTCVRLKE